MTQISVTEFNVGDVVKSRIVNWMSQDAIEEHGDAQRGMPGEIISIDLSGGTAVVLVYTRFMHDWLVREGLSHGWFVLNKDNTKYKHVLAEMKLCDLVLSDEPIPEPTANEAVEDVFPSGGRIAVWQIYSLIKPLDREKPCHFKKCADGKQSKLTVLNYFGSVYVRYTCDACFAKYNGKLFESLPELKDGL